MGVARISQSTDPREPISAAGQWTGTILIAALAAIPLAILPGLFLEYYTTPKLVIAYLAAALLLLRAEDWWPGVPALWHTSRGRFLYVLLLAQLASLFISTAISHDLTLALSGTTSRRFGAVTEAVVLLIVAATAAHASLRTQSTRRLLIAIEVSGGA